MTILSRILPGFATIAFGSIGFMGYSQVMINELMQSNIDCIMDDLNEFPDSWLELYNPSEQEQDISGFILSLSDDPSEGYALPEGTIVSANGYLLVYCDKTDSDLHTDFRIDSGKGSLYLFDAQGNQIDGISSLKKQPAPNVAYGREEDGSKTWGYQLTPTPGASNQGGVSNVVLEAPIFSKAGGVWVETTPFTLELSLPADSPSDAIIRYTLDGKEPTTTVGFTYNEPIAVDSSMVIRAKVMCDGCISIPSSVNSYIFLGREQKIPLVSLVIDPDYLYDDEIGIYVDGAGGEDDPNYGYKWRRPLNFEFFDPEQGEALLNQLCETRIQGNSTRSHPMKSMVLYANKRFGVKRFEHEFWAYDKPGMDQIKSFILRNGGSSFCRGYIHDALAQRVLGHNTDFVDWQAYSPAIIYLNGEYLGMLAMRERSDEDNIYSNYDGLEDVEIVDYLDTEKAASAGTPEIIPQSYWDWLDFGKTTHSFEEWGENIDLESYAAMFILRTWISDTDFPGNNQVLWRRTDGVDGRWRALLKDCDLSMGLFRKSEYTFNYHKDWLMRYQGQSNLRRCYTLLYNLWACEEYKEMYIDRTIAYFGDFLNANTFLPTLDRLIEETCGEQEISHIKWNQIWSDMGGGIYVRTLESDYEVIRDWIIGRQDAFAAIVQEAFELGTPVPVKVNESADSTSLENFSLVYANTKLTKPTFNGTDYIGRTIRLEGTTDL